MCNIVNKIKGAKESIVLVDDFVDEATVSFLNMKDTNVSVEVISRNRLMANVRNIRRRQNFKAGFKFIESNAFRNRYIFIDGKVLFLLSRSLRSNSTRGFYYIPILEKEQLYEFKLKVSGCENQERRRFRHF